MTVSRARAGSALRGPCGALLLALALLPGALAAPAHAQQGPIRLTPPQIIEEAPPPSQASPPPAASPSEATGTAKSDIVVSPTPALDVNAAGLIDETRGGLPATLWNGSTRPVIDRLLDRLPAPNFSPSARGLATRVLTSAGTPPTDRGEARPGFAALRAERLMAMGNVDAATALARAIPRRDENETLSRILLDAALIGNDDSGACQIAREGVGRFNTIYWQKALIFCQALAGEHSRAQLGLSMLREQHADDDDPAFVRLVLAIGGDKRAAGELPPDPMPLHLAMLRAAQQPVPPAAVEKASPPILRMIAQSPSASAETRLAAAQRAEAEGALPTEALIQIFEAVEFSHEDLAKALTLAEKAPAPRAHAAIYRAAKAQLVGIARAEALSQGWRIARARGFYPGAVRTTLPLLRDLSPAPELAWFAADAGRALLLAGDRDQARRWYELARAEAKSGGRTDQSELLLWPLLRLAGAEVTTPDAAGLATWLAAQEKLDAAQAPARAALLTSLLEGLGDGTDGSLSALLLSGDLAPQTVSMPSPALWLGRDGAASAGRVGETALFVIDSLGANGPVGWSSHTMIAAIQALRAVNLEKDARAMAVEAAITAGL